MTEKKKGPLDFGPNVILIDGAIEPEKPKGVHSVKKTLADGRIAIYDYAWKGGPRLTGPRGSTEYLASREEVFRCRNEARIDHSTVAGLVAQYRASEEFAPLSDVTKKYLSTYLDEVIREFGDMPLTAMTVRGTRHVFKEWRTEIIRGTKPPLHENTPANARVQSEDGSEKRPGSRAQASRHWQALNRVLHWALDEELIDANPCQKGGRVYWGTRRELIWTADRETRFFHGVPEENRLPAPIYLQDAYFLAVWTGQREGDLVRIRWSAYDGVHLRLQQHKRYSPSRAGKRLKIKVSEPLKRRLDLMALRQGITDLSEEERGKRHMVVNCFNRPWKNAKSFSAGFHKCAALAGVPDRTFHDLRGTAVLRFALNGSSIPQIMAVTGHSLSDVRSVFEAHYLSLDEELGDIAVEKREKSRVFPTDLAPKGTIDIGIARNLSNAFSTPPTALPTGPQLASVGSLSVQEEQDKIGLLINEVRELQKRLG